MKTIDLNSLVWKRLQDWRETLPHALLLTGPRGLGKQDLARDFAGGLLCEQPRKDGLACGQCLACRWYSQGNHPDFRVLMPEAQMGEEGTEEKSKRSGQQITVDQIRTLDEFFAVGTHRQGLRIILVYPADSLNRNAANAILKVLEEPPPSTLFLLVSNEPMRLLPTLRSRCQTLPIPIPSRQLAEQVLQEEGVSNPDVWLALAGGCPETACKLAAQNGTDWLEALTTALGSGGKLDVLLTAGALEKIIKSAKGEHPLRQTVDWVQKWAIDLSLAAHHLPTRYYLRQRARIETLVKGTSPEGVIRFYRQLIVLRQESEHPLNVRLFLENILFSYRALFVE